MHRNLLAGLGMVLAGILAGQAMAQDTGNDGDTSFVVGFVRLDYILEKSTRISEKVAVLQKEYREAQNILDQRYRQIMEQREALDRRRDLMSTDTYNSDMAHLRQQLEEYRDNYEQNSAKLETKKRAVLEPEVDWLWKIVDTIGKDRKFDLILDEADIAYGAKEFDISDDILRRFDESPPPPKPVGTTSPASTAANPN